MRRLERDSSRHILWSFGSRRTSPTNNTTVLSPRFFHQWAVPCVSARISPVGAGGDPHDLIAGHYFAFLQHTEIEARSTARDEQRGHLRLIHTDAHPVTGDARLSHLEQSAADPVPVADAHLFVRQAIDGEVLPELPVGEVVSTQFVLPIAIGVDLINEDGPVLAAVTGQIPLSIAVDVESAYHARVFNRRLPDGGVDGPALPHDVARQAHID